MVIQPKLCSEVIFSAAQTKSNRFDVLPLQTYLWLRSKLTYDFNAELRDLQNTGIEPTIPTFACSKSTINALEKGVILVFLLLPLNTFHTFF